MVSHHVSAEFAASVAVMVALFTLEASLCIPKQKWARAQFGNIAERQCKGWLRAVHSVLPPVFSGLKRNVEQFAVSRGTWREAAASS